MQTAGAGVETIISRPLDLANSPGWVEILAADVSPRWRGGVISCVAHVVDFPFTFTVADVRIVGYVGTAPITLVRASLAGDGAPIEYRLEEIAPYSRLAVLVRRRTNGGDPLVNLSSFTPGSLSVAFSAQARMVTT
jgi:hypothetical protein